MDNRDKIGFIEQVIATAQEATLLCDGKGKLIGGNALMFQLLGAERSDLLDQNIDEVLSVQSDTEESTSQIIQQNIPFEAVTNGLSGRTFVISPQPFSLDTEELVYILRFHDSRQKGGYLEELRRLSLSASQSLACVLLIDTDQAILWSNSQFNRKFQTDKKELHGSNLFEVVQLSVENRNILESGIQKVKDSGEPVQLELEPEPDQEDPCWFSLDISPAYSEDGELIHLILLLRDISQNKAAERDRSAHEQRLKRAQQLAKLGEFEYDVKCKQTYWSKTLLKLLEVRSDQLIEPQDFANFLHEDQKEQWKKALDKTIESGEQQRFQLRFFPHSERVINVVVNLSRESRGGHYFLLGTVEDVTELEEARSKLEQALIRAEESARVKQEFLANMSHEIRTPMNSILGFSRLLLRSQMLDEENTEFAQAIYESAEKLHIVLDEILSVARLESSDLALDRHHIRSEDFIASLQKLHERKAREKGLSLELMLDSAFPEVILTDHVRVFQILSNLLDNAIKFTDEGKIRISAKALNQDEEGFVACFVVKDTGIGISKEAIQGIFESFQQADSSISRRYEGAGLGLSIVRRLIRLLNGTISVKSEPWEGSEFILEIPMQQGDPEQIKGFFNEEDEAAKHLEGQNVLLVEDNRNNRLLARKFLNDLGMNSYEAHNGIQAIGKVREMHYDFILMDIQMPEMDGIEATKLIRKMPGAIANIPIIAVTAHVLKDEIDSYGKVGMNAVINKPLKKGELIATMLNLMDQEPGEGKPVSPSPDSGKDPNFETINLKGLLSISRGDQDFIQEMINAYFEDMPVYMSEFKNAFQLQDMKRLGKMAHKMKSPLNIVGITAIDADLENLENLPEEPEQEDFWKTLEPTIEKIEAVVSRGSDELKVYQENALN